MTSCQVEEKKGEMLREIMGVPAGQMSFLSEAWMQIVKCRRVLKWTYAYGFYLTDDNATRHDFFEHVQVSLTFHGPVGSVIHGD